MRWSLVLRIIGALILCVGLCMIPALCFSAWYGDAGVAPLAASTLIASAAGLTLFLACRGRYDAAPMNHREGMAITTFGWAAAGLVGALPFAFGDVFPGFTECVFESVSGFTTTGSSALTDIEAVPKGILFWRSMTHWIGGMGIIVLSLAILPFLGVGGMQLYKAEVPGPVPDKLRPRIKDTAMALWRVYLLLSAVETVLLMFGGMDLFDALCHSFGTMATGGFSTRNASVAAYGSAYIDTVITVFMLVAGINFTLHYRLFTGKARTVWSDPELKGFLGIFAVFTAVTVFCVMGSPYKGFGDSLRYSAFQVASILTTTGFATADYEVWPYLPQCILLLCMFIGGSAGSTGGGMKVMRLMLLCKASSRELFRLIHPRAVAPVKFGRVVVPEDVLRGVWGFFFLWLALLFVATFCVAASGLDVTSSFAAVLACIGNIGPGIGSVGPIDNYAHVPDFAKWVLTLCMLLGRLEIYTVLVLLVPEFWRK